MADSYGMWFMVSIFLLVLGQIDMDGVTRRDANGSGLDVFSQTRDPARPVNPAGSIHIKLRNRQIYLFLYFF